MDELIKIYPVDINIKTCFFVPAEDANDKRTIVAERILAAWHGSPVIQKQQVMTKWFEEMDIEKWERCFPHPHSNEPIARYLLENQAWCTRNNITHTPAIFLNGYELPQNYTAGDLKLIIPSFLEFIPKPAEKMQDQDIRLASQG
ncbi:MAG: hypothetical protein JST09_04000 [Bacteroidetes bacterium]|nr:hypothetical protein [Bacteroidota bacterium]MBS1610814.1 hypothetical protein [Bacteroidota bacterium]